MPVTRNTIPSCKAASCAECGRAFSRLADVRRHYRTAHDPESESKKLSCPFPGCLYRTMERSNIRVHQLSVHKRQSFPCDMGCGALLSSMSALSHHLRYVHGSRRPRKPNTGPSSRRNGHSVKAPVSHVPDEISEVSSSDSPPSTPNLTNSQDTAAYIQWRNTFSGLDQDIGSLAMSGRLFASAEFGNLSWSFPIDSAQHFAPIHTAVPPRVSEPSISASFNSSQYQPQFAVEGLTLPPFELEQWFNSETVIPNSGNGTQFEYSQTYEGRSQSQQPSTIDPLEILLKQYTTSSIGNLSSSSLDASTFATQPQIANMQPSDYHIDPSLLNLSLNEPQSSISVTSDFPPIPFFSPSSFSYPYSDPINTSVSSFPSLIGSVQPSVSSAALQHSHNSTFLPPSSSRVSDVYCSNPVSAEQPWNSYFQPLLEGFDEIGWSWPGLQGGNANSLGLYQL